MATAPSHYIRTIHTPFTAASSSAWATASRGSQTLNHHHHNHLSNINALNNLGHPLQGQFAYARTERDGPNYSPSINSHNSHFYTQHLQSLSYPPHHNNNVHQLSNGQYVSISPKVAGLRKNAASSGLTSTANTVSHGPSGAAGGGRRRSASIRVPPPSFVPTHAPPPQTYKFDPFGDEPLSSSSETSVMPLSSGSQANRISSSEAPAEPETTRGSAPYTIHIPPAQPIEIQRYSSPPRSPRPASRALPPKAASLISLGPISPPRSSPPPADVIVPRQQSSGGPNLSKIVAGILLNRVHAVGKPMRRRVLPKGQGYRKSCLSSVVSVEA
ncbi:hypothetical protein M413DRAFT_6715 [Hebeloma cylindrosporum]|uniref:Uncharacterized protein n=1 Tax=Hebeloma cylindrosporum TaxID=76867 RepID=A0A0C3CMG7_HEBCY|nr:hypothetical protein M413DRAFT_6715 [Hebeloma cylindrosporum h7]